MGPSISQSRHSSSGRYRTRAPTLSSGEVRIGLHELGRAKQCPWPWSPGSGITAAKTRLIYDVDSNASETGREVACPLAWTAPSLCTRACDRRAYGS